MIAALKSCLFFLQSLCACCITLARARAKTVFGHLKLFIKRDPQPVHNQLLFLLSFMKLSSSPSTLAFCCSTRSLQFESLNLYEFIVSPVANNVNSIYSPGCRYLDHCLSNCTVCSILNDSFTLKSSHEK